MLLIVRNEFCFKYWKYVIIYIYKLHFAPLWWLYWHHISILQIIINKITLGVNNFRETLTWNYYLFAGEEKILLRLLSAFTCCSHIYGREKRIKGHKRIRNWCARPLLGLINSRRRRRRCCTRSRGRAPGSQVTRQTVWCPYHVCIYAAHRFQPQVCVCVINALLWETWGTCPFLFMAVRIHIISSFLGGGVKVALKAKTRRNKNYCYALI